jgi:hypothetical protein
MTYGWDLVRGISGVGSWKVGAMQVCIKITGRKVYIKHYWKLNFR